MCIRDSVFGDAKTADKTFQPVARLPHEIHRFLMVVLPLVTVSYTHLRAHETVLDLVCRLLLDKKKTKHYILNRTYTSVKLVTHT